jgi:hypothetical protein
VQDIRLIFSNAKLFNPPEHAVHIAADALSLKFERSLTLAVTELKELHRGNVLLRMPIPSADGSNASHSDCRESFLATVVLAFAKEPATTGAGSTSASTVTFATGTSTNPGASEQNIGSSSCLGKRAHDSGYTTPPCTAVSRSGSLVDEKEFYAAAVLASALHPATPVVIRSRAQSISVTPISPSKPLAALAGTAGAEKAEVEEITEVQMRDEQAKLRLQHVVSQDFQVVARSAIGSGVSDDKRKAAETDAVPAPDSTRSPESATKRRRLTEEVVSLDSYTATPAISGVPNVTTLPSSVSNVFSAATHNTAHVAVPFTVPVLGSQNTMTIVAELSKRMQRQYDDLFVIKLSPPRAASPSSPLADKAPVPATTTAGAASTGNLKKMRGRAATVVKKTPAVHVPGGLKSMGPTCRALLASLKPDTSDPDPAISSPVTDSRHVFLELCQFRHYQFDSLRRAKHSSLMLLYHLQNPHDKRCHACCSHCDEKIHSLRWHCDECPNFDLCGNCYTADMARRSGPLHLSRHTSFSVSAAETLEPVLDSSAAHGAITGEAGLALPHPHVLTPYRVSNH